MMRNALVVGAVLALVGCGGDASRPEALPEAIAFSSNRDGDFEIYSMRPDGSGVRQLTENTAEGENEADDGSPAWSADGTMIAFESTRDHAGDGLADTEVYVMRADGSDEKRLSGSAKAEFGPEWLPDGRVAFRRCGDDLTTCRLVAVRADGTGLETISTDLAVTFGSLSSDGSQVVFTRSAFPSDEPTDLYVSGLDGGNEQRLTESEGRDSGAAWSPDGSMLAFASDRDGNGDCLFHDCTGSASELYVMAVDGSEERRLTRFSGEDVVGSWSPDGTRILFLRIRDEQDDYELYVVNSDGSCETRLTDNDAWDVAPDWRGGEATGRISC